MGILSMANRLLGNRSRWRSGDRIFQAASNSIGGKKINKTMPGERSISRTATTAHPSPIMTSRSLPQKGKNARQASRTEGHQQHWQKRLEISLNG